MSCESVREFLLHVDWDASRRVEAAEFLRHYEQCGECQAAMADFDEVRLILSPADAPEPSGGWEAMRERLVRPIPLHRHNWIGPVMAMAASVLFAFGAFQMGRQTTTKPAGTVATHIVPETRPMATAVAPPDVSKQVDAFRVLSEYYQGRTSWIVFSQNNANPHKDSEMGFIPTPASSTARMLVLRLGLWQGDERISSADLIVIAGERAESQLPLPSGRSLHYRIDTSRDEATQLALWLDLQTPDGGEPLATLSTHLRIQPGEKVSAGKLATTTGEYELKIDFAGAEPANVKS